MSPEEYLSLPTPDELKKELLNKEELNLIILASLWGKDTNTSFESRLELLIDAIINWLRFSKHKDIETNQRFRELYEKLTSETWKQVEEERVNLAIEFLTQYNEDCQEKYRKLHSIDFSGFAKKLKTANSNCNHQFSEKIKQLHHKYLNNNPGYFEYTKGYLSQYKNDRIDTRINFVARYDADCQQMYRKLKTEDIKEYNKIYKKLRFDYKKEYLHEFNELCAAQKNNLYNKRIELRTNFNKEQRDKYGAIHRDLDSKTSQNASNRKFIFLMPSVEPKTGTKLNLLDTLCNMKVGSLDFANKDILKQILVRKLDFYTWLHLMEMPQPALWASTRTASDAPNKNTNNASKPRALELKQCKTAGLKGIILKPNMILPGNKLKNKSSTEEIAKMTLKCLKENVPGEVPGIAFLSGGQSEVEATQNLNEIIRKSQKV